MIDKLESFYRRIPEEDRNKSSSLILYLAFFCADINQDNQFTAKQVKQCFIDLHLKPYSNIPSFLSLNSKGKTPKFFRTKDKYKIERSTKRQITEKMNITIPIPITDNFFSMELLENTRDYIRQTASQMCKCYEIELYDAALVMMRKLIETLIIECFERYNATNGIKDSEDNFLFLSHLIPAYLNKKEFSVSKNTKKSLMKLKEKGDLSAHNRRFIAKRPDLDNCKFELRQFVQDIVYLIDYPNWNNEKVKKTN